MFLGRFALAAAILLVGIPVEGSWEVEQGSKGNELLLKVKNFSDQALMNVSVEIEESPQWAHFEAGGPTAIDTLGPEEAKNIVIPFDVSERVPPRVVGNVRLLVMASEASWIKEIQLVVLPASIPPRTTTLLQNSPNPLHRSTAICYHLAQPARVTLKLYTLAGRLVKTLVNEDKLPGRYEVLWTGKDGVNEMLPDGTYLCRLDADGVTCTKKLILLR